MIDGPYTSGTIISKDFKGMYRVSLDNGNEKILAANPEIKKVFEELNIKPYIIKGDYEQREKLLDELMNNLNIELK